MYAAPRLRLALRAALVALALASPAPAQTLAGAQFLTKWGVPVPKSPGSLNLTDENAVDQTTGEVYVLETFRVQVFAADGTYLRQWSCSGCGGIEVNAATGHVYVTTTANTVRRFTTLGSFVNQWGGTGSANGQFNRPFGLAIDPATNNVYVRDTGNARVQVFDAAGAFLFAFGSAGSLPGQFLPIPSPAGIAFDPVDRMVYTTDPFSSSISKFDAAGGFLLRFGGVLGLGLGQLRWARNVEVDADGRVYVTDTDNERIQVFSASGDALFTFQGPHTRQAGPFHPRSIAIHRATGAKYVNAAYAFRVDRFDGEDAFVGSFGTRQMNGSFLEDPRGLAVSPTTGDVYVLDSANMLVKRFSPGGAFRAQWGGSSRLGVDLPGLVGFVVDSALTVDPDGDVWKGMTGIHYAQDPASLFVEKTDANGNLRVGWPRSDLLGVKYDEWIAGIAIDPASRDVWLADPGFGRLRRYDAAGNEILSIPNLPGPAGVAFSDGSVWVTLSGTDRVRRYALDGTLLADWGGSGSGQPQLLLDEASGITALPSGNLLVADTYNHRIKEFTPSGAFVAELGTFGSGDGQFSFPRAALPSPSGELLYVLDSINDRVQVFCLTSPAACAARLDADADGVPDQQDNCPEVADAQPDTGSVARPSDPDGAASDGIGDGCQCGALDADGDVDANDLGELRLYLADLAAIPLERCSVAGGAECDLLDQVVLARAFAGQYPGARQVCAAAVP